MIKRSNLLIRDYNDIRRILRDIYIFGCYSREDFINRGISGRKYDNEQRRINAYLPDGFIKKRRENGRVLYYCSYDLNKGDGKYLAENYLAETYRNKSFTMLDISAYFWVLSVLERKPGLSLQEVLEEIPSINEYILFTKDNLRIKLAELEERRLIYSRKEARNVRYYLVDDIWASFSVEELQQIYLYLYFVRNIMPLEMPYVFLQERLRLYMYQKGVECMEESVFQIKHSHLFNVLDNEIMLQLLQAINDQNIVGIKRSEGKDSVQVIPVRIIHDCSYGRQYLLCVEYIGKPNIMAELNDTAARMIRLDRIDEVILGEHVDGSLMEMAHAAVENAQECWCTSGLGEPLHKVVINVMTTEQNEPYILRRLYREGHGGEVIRISEGIYQYSVFVRDPLEMTPWIRSFGEHMKVIDDDGTGLADRIDSDWKEAVKKYEAL